MAFIVAFDLTPTDVWDHVEQLLQREALMVLFLVGAFVSWGPSAWPVYWPVFLKGLWLVFLVGSLKLRPTRRSQAVFIRLVVLLAFSWTGQAIASTMGLQPESWGHVAVANLLPFCWACWGLFFARPIEDRWA